MKKLERLLALATLKPGEEDNEARINEARTAAFVMVQAARKEGVTIRFEGEAPAAEKPVTGSVRDRDYARPSSSYSPPSDASWADFLREYDENRAAGRRTSPYPDGTIPHPRWSPPTEPIPGVFKDAEGAQYGLIYLWAGHDTAGLTCRSCGEAIEPDSWVYAQKKKNGSYSMRVTVHEHCATVMG